MKPKLSMLQYFTSLLEYCMAILTRDHNLCTHVYAAVSTKGCATKYAGGDFEDQDNGKAVHEGVQE